MNRTKIHREGTGVLVSFALLFVLLCVAVYFFVPTKIVFWLVVPVCCVLMGLALNFFRFPHRFNPQGSHPLVISCPADGEVVAIEETMEQEFLHCRCLQVSIFMSLYDVHANWIACNGTVTHVSHQEGAFYKAFLPKSSTQNERSAVLIETATGHTILERQIAGAVARRICVYPQKGDKVTVADFMGFIKFGSRLDLYLPLGSKMEVAVGDKVRGGVSTLGYLPQQEENHE